MKRRDFRYVAHIDILGMSEIVAQDSTKAWELLSSLMSVRQDISEHEFAKAKTRQDVEDIFHIVSFSDTILVFTKSDSKDEFFEITVLVTEIFIKALAKDIPIRAAIAYGEFFFSLERDMYMGTALIDAYRVGEATQWLGITFSKSVHDRISNLKFLRSNNINLIEKWPIPAKDGTYDSFAVNWSSVFFEELGFELPINVEKFYSRFEKRFGSYASLSDSAKRKYVNTVAFMNAMYNATNSA